MNIQTELSAEDCIETGWSYHSENNFEKAVLYYEKALKLNSQDPRLYFLLGTALSQLKNYTEAEHFLLKSLNENPFNQSTYQNLGKLYKETNNPHSAKSIYEKAIETIPDWFDIYFELLHVYIHFKMFDRALSCVKLLEKNQYELPKTYWG